jgi:L-arabinose isomerase
MAPDALGHLEVWLVTGSQEMYGPATLRQVEAHAREVAAGLDAQPDVPRRKTVVGHWRELEVAAQIRLGVAVNGYGVGR